MSKQLLSLLKASAAFALLFILLLPAASAEQGLQPVKASLVDWDGAHGLYTAPPHTAPILPSTTLITGYNLLAQALINPGQNGELRSLDFKNLIFQWLDHHPNALVRPVATSGSDAVRRQMGLPPTAWVWVADGPESLNEYLVRRGACRSQALDVFVKPTFEAYPGINRPHLLISQAAYHQFRLAVLADEAAAKRQKLGVWSPVGAAQTDILPMRGASDGFRTALGSALLTPFAAMYGVDRAKIGLAPLPPGAKCTLSLNGPKERQAEKLDAGVQIEGEPAIDISFILQNGRFEWVGESDVYSDPQNPSAFIGLDYYIVSLPHSLEKPHTLTVEYDGSDKRLSETPNLTLADVKPTLAKWAAEQRR